MNLIKISVIIPVYNVEKYLEECLDSVVNQSIGESIEIIIINDGSSDNSQTIIDKYKSKYSNIKSIEQENRGLSAARNVGLRVARGQYIFFMDSDDKLDITALKTLYDLAKMDDLDVVFFEARSFLDVEYCGKYNVDDFNYKKKFDYNGIYKGIDILKELVHNEDYYAPVWSKLFKRNLLLENEIYFIEGIIHEDEWFSLISFVKSERVKVINDAFFYRRIRNGSIMTNKNYEKSFVGFTMTIYKYIELYISLDESGKNSVKEWCSKVVAESWECYNKIRKKNSYVRTLYKELRCELKKVNFFQNKRNKLKFSFYIVFKIRRRVKEIGHI